MSGSGDGLHQTGNRHSQLDNIERCTGAINGNRNIQVSARRTHLELNSNRTCQVDASGGKLRMRNCRNMDLRGKDNDLDISNDKNTEIFGDGNKGRISGNRNAKITANEISSLNIINNRNLVVSGSNGTVEAEGNYKVQIIGDEHNVKVKNARKLEIQRANENNGKLENKFQVVTSNANGSNYSSRSVMNVTSGSSSVSVVSSSSESYVNSNGNSVEVKNGVVYINGERVEGEFGNGTTVAIENGEVYINGNKVDRTYGNTPPVVNLKYKVKYVNSGSVIGDSYVLGRFTFKIRKPDSCPNEMFVDIPIQKDNDLRVRRSTTQKEAVTIQNRGGAQDKEILTISGPRVEILEDNRRTVSIRIKLNR